MLRFVLLMILFGNGAFEEVNDIKQFIHLYETNLDSSIKLDREDKVLMKTWKMDFQVKRVSVTAKYRTQMMKYKENSFRKITTNTKWTECLFLYRRPIRKSEKEYYSDETECLTNTATVDKDKMKAVRQVEKETRKWRKGYRYLVNNCNVENPNDKKAADTCLVQYMEQDSYSKVIQRLIHLKMDATAQLCLQLLDSVKVLEDCLKTQLYAYLDRVRTIMETLNRCYSFTAPSDNNTTALQ